MGNDIRLVPVTNAAQVVDVARIIWNEYYVQQLIGGRIDRDDLDASELRRALAHSARHEVPRATHRVPQEHRAVFLSQMRVYEPASLQFAPPGKEQSVPIPRRVLNATLSSIGHMPSPIT